ncbi:MAG: T9SS type A sorting domain-containing protein, partial [Saprospiraceae bacterium]|nr:T9SS type A sorting domain-containing protein [Bacteroidia bacterium]NNL92489.1 T9SS type A sorting domain-containing protein [Saprospiraceae bacterium]
GNANIVWATVLLEDKSGTIPVIPPHMFLTCDMDYNDFSITGGIPRFYGACGELPVECDTMEVYESTEPRELRLSDGVVINGVPQEAPAYDPSCGYGAIRRQFKDCGGGEQWFVILPIDPFDDSSIRWPGDVVVDCDAYDFDVPTWQEATCNLIGLSMNSDTFLFEDGACFKILNNWSIINWCIYDPSVPNSPGRYDYTQVIKIIDTQDPVLTVQDSLCFAVDANCLSSDVSLSGSAVDEGDCGSEWISYDVIIDAYADWTEDYHYATTNPRLLPNGSPNPYHIPKTGNGELATINLPDGIPSSKIWHRAVWRVFDGCGNTVSATRYFQIVDKKKPTPYCLNLSTAVMENGQVELWAIDFNVGSFDNCTDSDNLLFTFTDIPPPPRFDEEYDSNDDLMWYNGTYWFYNSEEIDLATGAGEYEKLDAYGDEVHRWEPGLRSSGAIFTADDADATGFATIPIYVWDECGNIDFCLVNLRLVDNGGGSMAMVTGQVKTELGEEVEQVETRLNSLNYNNSDMTDATGTYAFANTPMYADYKVSGTKTDDYLNGVSTLDLVLIQRHILGMDLLDSPYKMIAADINRDDNISSLDLIELRKLILGIYDELPNNASWTLVNSNNTLTVDNPWTYESSRTIADLTADMNDEDFIGVKIGDVNNSVVANAQNTGIITRSSSIDINYEDKMVKAGEEVELTLTTDRSDVFGYQFTLNTKGLELVKVTGNNLTQNNVGVFANRLTMSYNENQAIDAGNLVTFVMKATTSGQLSEMLSMGSEVTQAEAYVGSNLEVVDIDLRDNTKGEFVLYQNEPNPFTEYTMISFEMPQGGSATLSLFDVTGKVLKVVKANYAAGYNSVKVTREDLGAAGMVYYKLETEDNTATKHMVVIK